VHDVVLHFVQVPPVVWLEANRWHEFVPLYEAENFVDLVVEKTDGASDGTSQRATDSPVLPRAKALKDLVVESPEHYNPRSLRSVRFECKFGSKKKQSFQLGPEPAS
jgi:hypothetical protein